MFTFFIAVFGLFFAVTGCDGTGGRHYDSAGYWRNFGMKILTMTAPGALVMWLIVRFAGDASF